MSDKLRRPPLSTTYSECLWHILILTIVIYLGSKRILPQGRISREGPSATTANLHAALRVVVELLSSEEAQHNGRAEGLQLFLQQQPCCKGERYTCRSCRPYRSEIEGAIDAWAEAGLLSQRLRWALPPQGDTGGTPDTPLEDEHQGSSKGRGKGGDPGRGPTERSVYRQAEYSFSIPTPQRRLYGGWIYPDVGPRTDGTNPVNADAKSR